MTQILEPLARRVIRLLELRTLALIAMLFAIAFLLVTNGVHVKVEVRVGAVPQPAENPAFRAESWDSELPRRPRGY